MTNPLPQEERQQLITSLRESEAFSAAIGLYADPTALVDWLMDYVATSNRRAVEAEQLILLNRFSDSVSYEWVAEERKKLAQLESTE